MHKRPTKQEKFWLSKFGKDYMKRNNFTPQQLDKFYVEHLGVTRSKINKDFVGNLNIKNTLEVGCNIGVQINMLKKNKHKLGQIYGIELLPEAVEVAKANTKNCNIIQGSAFDIPFKDKHFDLVYTSGVLIHISPENLPEAIKEINRVSNKYIWGVEFYNPKHIEINYRRHKNYHWKGDFAKIYMDNIPGLKLIKESRYEKIKGEIWTSFLLKKI